MKKLSQSDKKKMLWDAVILNYTIGDFTESIAIIGKPLSFFDYDKVFDYIVELNNINIKEGGNDLFEYQTEYFGYKVKTKKRK
jgi:hypothetical protein